MYMSTPVHTRKPHTQTHTHTHTHTRTHTHQCERNVPQRGPFLRSTYLGLIKEVLKQGSGQVTLSKRWDDADDSLALHARPRRKFNGG